MRRKHEPPEQLAHVRASADDLEAWNQRDREARTCFHCGTTYISGGYATQCEQLHEHHDDVHREEHNATAGR